MEGEIAGSAEIASCYVICDTCPTSSDLGQMGFGLALHPCYKEVNQLFNCTLSTDGGHSTEICSR